MGMNRFIFHRRHETGFRFAMRRASNMAAVLWGWIGPYLIGAVFGIILAVLFFLWVTQNEDDRQYNSGGTSGHIRPADPNTLRTGPDTGSNPGRENMDNPRKLPGDRSGQNTPFENQNDARQEKDPEVAGFDLDQACVALNIYHEARYEPIKGKFAVAFVTMNRASQRNMNMCEVVFERRQFSWANNARDENGKLLPEYYPADDRYWREARMVAREAMALKVADFTHGATFYHADYIRKPSWAYKMRPAGKWGHHVFYIKPSSYFVPSKHKKGTP
jgi:N-acetylmuramoyl-L-alanine amidase